MEQIVLDGKRYSKEIEAELIKRVETLKEKGVIPTLATILVGDDKSSEMYVKMKGKACARVGIKSKKIVLPKDTTTEELLSKIEELNNDNSVYGILLQHPVPRTINESMCFNAIRIDKDVDGVNTHSFGKFAMKEKAFISCTPYGVIKLLKHYNIELTGKDVVVVGRSAILGKPLAMLLLNENATVTICHTKTKDLNKKTKKADIVVGCAGCRNLITKVKKGAVLVDCGYSDDNVGDIDKKCIKYAKAYTPIPGGVGPMTIATLLEQTVISAENRLK